MTVASAPRRLAAILAADVVGYSKLMGADEEGARAMFNDHLDQRLGPAIEAHHGRIVKTMGDGLLVEFASAVDAVRCAFDAQSAIEASNAEAGADGAARMKFRIGVNLGDVIVEGDDIHGDGVNVAARLEGLAEPGGVVVSGVVHDIIRGKVPFAFDDLGPQTVKNIAAPVPAYRIRKASGAAGPPPAPPPRIPDKPSIAVLPFANIGGDPEQTYFAEGVADDLITDLSNIAGLFVVARNAAFARAAAAEDVAEAGRRLGARNVLTGGVRRAEERLRINVRLVDSETGEQIWAARHDGTMDDAFALQDEISAQVIAALKPRLTSGDALGAARRPTRSMAAYDLCLKGRSEYFRYTPPSAAKAKAYFEEAIALDPEYAEPYAYLSYCLSTMFVWNFPGADPSLDRAVKTAEEGVRLAPNWPVAHARLGWVLAYTDRVADAVASFETALDLDAENGEVLYTAGESMNRMAMPKRGLPLLEKLAVADPHAPPGWGNGVGHSYVLLDRFEDAAAHLSGVLEAVPNMVPARVQLIVAQLALGDVAGTRDQGAVIRRTFPRYDVESALRMFPYPDSRLRARFRDAMITAGLPE